jgi:hypothetical protein
MEDRLARLESRVEYLAERVGNLEERLGLVERHASSARASAPDDSDAVPIVDIRTIPVQHWLGLAGRTLVVLGGAYLLRALTESRVLSTSGGVGLGILYGAPWLLLASRATRRGAQLDGFAHVVTAALIGYPLVWEATLRFHVLSPEQSAALLGVLTAGAFVLSSARALQGLAWVAMIGAMMSAIGLAIGTGDWLAYTVLAIAVGVATLWLGYIRDWTMLRWPSAAIANFMLLIATARAAVHGDVSSALLVQMLMLTGYLGSFAIRTLLIGRPVIPFEVAQSIAVLVIAFGGAISLIRTSASNVLVVGVASVVLAIAAYVVAFAFIDRHRQVRNFFFYAQLAQLFAIVGIGLCLGSAAGSIMFAAAAVVAAACAQRTRRIVLSLQASVYVIAAMVASGLLVYATIALWSTAIDQAPIPVTSIVALAAALVVTFLSGENPVDSPALFADVLRCVLIALTVWTVAGMSIPLVMFVVPGGSHVGGSLLATIRTAAFVAATLVLAFTARHHSRREAGWLVYPLLVLTGVKLVSIDFPQGHPQTLFAALALYGIALSAAPRLLRGSTAPATPPDSLVAANSREITRRR